MAKLIGAAYVLGGGNRARPGSVYTLKASYFAATREFSVSSSWILSACLRAGAFSSISGVPCAARQVCTICWISNFQKEAVMHIILQGQPLAYNEM